MDAMSSQTQLIIGVIVVALIAVVAYLYYRQTQSKRLAHRFGREYGHAVDVLGSQDRAEAELRAREKRVKTLKIVPLSAEDSAKFGQAWRALQAKFVDNPHGAVAQADELVRELLHRRGYPVGDFESRAADISVDHPEVVSNYRAAQAIAVRDRAEQATTEDLRQALVHYRVLFAELLESKRAESHLHHTHISKAAS